ncbi:MAG: biotin--[acetyl-CoA-carboxylase] ligase [Alphaproteobacteria bacterium]|nr:biotin--[acetyl-CoA-carboxylase] ligase [Alphaproteobacteria bacterium]
MGGYKVFSFDKIPSTQDYAYDMIANGTARDHSVIVAMAQSAGRGRYRRKWVSHHGNLYASFIFDSPERDPRLSYAVAVAVAETILNFKVSPSIKWPNDILISGKKISGILIEYAGRFVIVGIGINVHTNPTVAEYETTRMDVHTRADVSEIFFMLAKNLDKWINANFDSVRARWMDFAMGINKLVKYRGESVELIGINDNGALVVRRGSEYLLIHGDEIMM